MTPLQRPSARAGFFYCEFWRSRRRHTWRPSRLPYHILSCSTDVQAVLSPLSDRVEISTRGSFGRFAGREFLAPRRILEFVPGGVGAVAPMHVLDEVRAPPHAFEAAARSQGLCQLQLAPRSGGVLGTVTNRDGAAVASAGEQCLLALGIFPAALARGRTLAPVGVFDSDRAPSRTCEIAASRHLDLAHRASDVVVAAFDRLRAKPPLGA